MVTRIHYAVIALLLCGSGAASAAEVTYVVNRADTQDSSFNGNYAISGFIVTDGSSSPGIADVKSWSVMVYSQQAEGSVVLTPSNSKFTSFGQVTATSGGLFLGGSEGPLGAAHLDSEALCGGGSYPCYYVHFDQTPVQEPRLPTNTYSAAVSFLFSNNGVVAANEIIGIGNVDGNAYVPGDGPVIATPLPPYLLVHRLFTRLMDRLVIAGPVRVRPSGDPLPLDVTFAESYYTAGDTGAATAALDSFIAAVREQSDQIPPGLSRQLVADAEAIEEAFTCRDISAARGCDAVDTGQ